MEAKEAVTIAEQWRTAASRSGRSIDSLGNPHHALIVLADERAALRTLVRDYAAAMMDEDLEDEHTFRTRLRIFLVGRGDRNEEV